MDSKSVCVYGAGCIGLDLAAQLIGGGHQVSLVARGENFERLRLGFRHINAAGQSRIISGKRYRLTDQPERLPPQDYIFLTVTADALLEISGKIGPMLKDTTVVVPATNGIPPWFPDRQPTLLHYLQGENQRRFDLFMQQIPREHLVGAVVRRVVGEHEGRLKTVRQLGGKGLVVGELIHGQTPRLEEMVRTLSGPEYKFEATGNIHQAIWSKLALNVYFNPLGAWGLSIGEIGRFGRARLQGKGAVKEILEIGKALGVADSLKAETIFTSVEFMRRDLILREHKPSSGQHSALGKLPEVFPIVGSALEYALAINRERRQLGQQPELSVSNLGVAAALLWAPLNEQIAAGDRKRVADLMSKIIEPAGARQADLEAQTQRGRTPEIKL